jgi:hypothetical protein
MVKQSAPMKLELIDTKCTIKTMKISNQDEPLCEVKQYRVSQLTKLPSIAKNSV